MEEELQILERLKMEKTIDTLLKSSAVKATLEAEGICHPMIAKIDRYRDFFTESTKEAMKVIPVQFGIEPILMCYHFEDGIVYRIVDAKDFPVKYSKLRDAFEGNDALIVSTQVRYISRLFSIEHYAVSLMQINAVRLSIDEIANHVLRFISLREAISKDVLLLNVSADCFLTEAQNIILKAVASSRFLQLNIHETEFHEEAGRLLCTSGRESLEIVAHNGLCDLVSMHHNDGNSERFYAAFEHYYQQLYNLVYTDIKCDPKSREQLMGIIKEKQQLERVQPSTISIQERKRNFLTHLYYALPQHGKEQALRMSVIMDNLNNVIAYHKSWSRRSWTRLHIAIKPFFETLNDYCRMTGIIAEHEHIGDKHYNTVKNICMKLKGNS